MTFSAQIRFIAGPVASVSGQFTLCRPVTDGEPPGPGVRPWDYAI